MKGYRERARALLAVLRSRASNAKPVLWVLASVLTLAIGSSAYLSFAVQDPGISRYHVYLTYAQSGKPLYSGTQLSVTATVRDDDFKPIAGARVLIVPDYEYNLGKVVTTGSDGSATATFNMRYQPGYIAWYTSGSIITRHILEATYLGDSVHAAATYNTIVMMSAVAHHYRLAVSRVGGGPLDGFESYKNLEDTRLYEVSLLDNTGSPVNGIGNSLGVAVFGPGVSDECFINAPATSCILGVNPNTFIKGANEIVFYQHRGENIGRSVGSYRAQTIWSTTGPYQRMTAPPTTAPLTTWWSGGGVHNTCYESSVMYNDTLAGRNVWIGYGARVGTGYVHFYPDNVKDLAALDNAYSRAEADGTELLITIWDEDDTSSGMLPGATPGRKCVDGVWKNVTLPAGSRVVNKLAYPAIGSIDSPTYLQSTWDERRVYALPPYSDPDYAWMFLDLLDTIRLRYDNAVAAATLKGISIGLGGNGEAIPISLSGSFLYEFGGACAIDWTNAFEHTLGTVQAGILEQGWKHIPIYQRNLMSYSGNGLWAIGKVGAGNQNMRSYPLSTSMSMWSIGAALRAAENWMGLRYGRRYAPAFFEEGSSSWTGGDEPAEDDFSGSFWRNLLWMPLRPAGYAAVDDYQCLYSDSSQGALAATMDKIITAATQPTERTADVAYLAFRGMGKGWPKADSEATTGSHEGLYMYSLDSWGNLTTPKYYTDVLQSGASLSHEFHNSVTWVKGSTIPSETSGAMLADGHALSIDVWDSWKWAAPDVSVTLAYTIGVMNRMDSGTLFLHYADTADTTDVVAIDISAAANAWAYHTGEITTVLRNAFEDGQADFTIEANGGPAWIVFLMIEGKQHMNGLLSD